MPLSKLRSSLLFKCFIIFLLGVSNHCVAFAEAMVTIRGNTMGTYYQIKFIGLRPIDIHSKVEAILDRINQQMSTYISQSEISLLSRSSSTDWQAVSKEFLEVANLSKKIHQMTRATFDPTVGPLVSLWGFGANYVPTRVPDSAALTKALENSGYDKIGVRHDPPSIRKEHESLQLDFSGIAKGYAVDEIAEFLESIGLTRYLVEIGGDLRSGLPKAEDVEWTIAVERPTPEPAGKHMRIFYPKGQGVATSGDYRNYFEEDGKRYSHIIDPTTGFPIENNVASVTVIAETCAEADGLATGMMVLGIEKGTKVAEEYGIPVLWIIREDHEFREINNKAFDKYLKP